MPFTPMIALVLTPLTTPAAHAGGPEEVGAWIRSAGVRSEAPTRVLAWVDDDQRASEAFASSFPSWVQGRIAAAAERELPDAASACEPSVRVSFVEPGSVGQTEPDQAFERSTFQVETLHCLEHGDAARAMAIYNSADFRETVMPGLERYRYEAGQVCFITSAVFGVVGRSEACLAAREFQGDGVRALHTQLMESVDAPDTQGVFLRESVVAFIDRAQGGVAVYRNVYTRGKDMGAVQRSLLGHAAGSSQDKIPAALEERLR
jgi:hypothetical protein